MPLQDINSRQDVFKLVNTFYAQIRKDEKLGPIFNPIIKDWDAHIALLTDFWETNLFFVKKYKGNPLEAHVKADSFHNHIINEKHFGHWINLWFKTIDSLFEGERAQLAKNRARNMSTFLNLEIHRRRPH
jgi:hemoglobin